MSNGGTVVITGGSLTIESRARFHRRERNGKHIYHHPETEKKITLVEIEGRGNKSGSFSFTPVDGKCTIRIHYESMGGKKAGGKSRKKASRK